MLNILVPMAGLGRRFHDAGYKIPKPLIMIHGMPMISVVVQNLKPNIPHRFIFICQKQQVEQYSLLEKFKEYELNMEVILLDHLTEGAACTALAAKSLINNENPLMIANCDQYIEISIDDYLQSMEKNQLDGLIMTMNADDPKWSYVGLDKNKLVNRVVEKEVISNEATVGIYNFKRGCDFVRSAESMIHKNLRVNNEFYVAPVYNELIQEGQQIGIYNVGTENNGMHGLGTPKDLEYFLSHPVSKKLQSCAL